MIEGQVSSRKLQALAPSGKRYCIGCEKYRSVKFFDKNGQRYYSRCRSCNKAKRRESAIPRRYGITVKQYEEIKAAQGGKCYICQRATGATKALAVDHDHSCCSGRTSCGKCVRGLCCGPCNSMLAHVRDSPETLERAADYLRNPPAKKVINEGQTQR